MDTKFIAVDTHTKIAYGLYNFFVPQMLYTVLLANFIESTSGLVLLVLILLPIAILLSLGLLFGGIFSYGKFLQIDDTYISICRKSFGNIKILQRINRNEVKEIAQSTYHHILLITNDEKKIKLLSTNPSLLLIILTVPFLSIPFMLRKHALTTIKLNEVNEALGIENSELEKQALQQKKSMKVIDFFMWLVLLLAMGVSLLGILVVLYALILIVSPAE